MSERIKGLGSCFNSLNNSSFCISTKFKSSPDERKKRTLRMEVSVIRNIIIFFFLTFGIFVALLFLNRASFTEKKYLTF